MIVIILTVVLIAACWKWGAWRKWREFYPTILYVIIGNLAYDFVFSDWTLWVYRSFMGATYVGLINDFLIYPSGVMLFLTHYPEGKWKQVGYILVWTVSSTLIEYISILLGGLEYFHGWSLLWSFLLFLGMFALIRLHYKKPLFVWPISLICGVAAALIFGLPPLE